MNRTIKNNVTWVGKIDWELRRFHGDEYSTHHGSSYNAYLIREQKTVLIDTVWTPYAKEFVANLQKTVDLATIDAIVMNHAEPDHSGALPDLMALIPQTPIYCTANGVKSIKGQYHQDWNFRVVKTGDKLNIGDKDLVFVEMPMLHWPDSMASYLTGDNIPFSNDAFGQHFASEHMFNDLVDQGELFAECTKYYANILTPFSTLVEKKIKEVLALGLPIDMICTSHGIIWRQNPAQIVEKYLQWAANYQENQVTLVYDTMWNGTRMMAESIAAGLTAADPALTVKLFNIAHSDKNDVITEVFKSKGVLFGSPTVNKGIQHAIAGFAEMVKGLRFKNKKAAAFGTYGWSGESPKQLAELLRGAGFEVLDDGLKALWNPNAEAVQQCIEYGRKFATFISGHR